MPDRISDLISDSLEACAEQDLDISDGVYQRFFAADKAAAELMDHSDQQMRGRMLQEVLQMLLSEDDTDYLTWEVSNHLLSYNVTLGMYATFFEALQSSVASELGDQWTPAYAQAWQAKTVSLLAQIKNVAPA